MIDGIADSEGHQSGRSRQEGGRCLPTTRYLRCDVLQREGKVWRMAVWRCPISRVSRPWTSRTDASGRCTPSLAAGMTPCGTLWEKSVKVGRAMGVGGLVQAEHDLSLLGLRDGGDQPFGLSLPASHR